MRRKKKIIITLLEILAIVIVAVIIFSIFVPKRKINEFDNGKNSGNQNTINPDEPSPNIEVILPEHITDINNGVSTGNTTNTNNPSNTSNNPSENPSSNNSQKTYEPLIEEFPARYLITLNPQGDKNVRILIGPDSEQLLQNNSKVQLSTEYPVNNVPENIKSEFTIKIDNYDYPIVLLLGESNKLYYVDIENAFNTGNFTVTGYVQNIPEVEQVYETTVNDNGHKYRSAVISCTDGNGYEFDLSMIGR